MRRLLYTVAAIGIAVVVGFWFVNYRATRLINTLLRDFATAETGRLSDSAYVLTVGTLHFNWSRRRVSLDSVNLSTDTERNNDREKPLPVTVVTLRNCTLGGISLSRLLFNRGLLAQAFGCRDVEFSSDAPEGLASAAAARPAPAAIPAPRRTRGNAAAGAFLSIQKTLMLPRQVPRLRIVRIAFPNVAMVLIQHYELGKRLSFNLERAQVRAEGFTIDPGDPTAAAQTLFSRSVTLSAEHALFLPDTATSASIARLDVDLTDSTLTILGLAYGPHITEAAFAGQSRWRRDRIRADADSLTVKGMDIHLFARTGAVRIRTLDLDGLHFEIRSDKRRPSQPGRRAPMRSIQQFMAARPRSWQIDSIRLRHSEVVYEEFAPGRDAPGRLVFAQLEALGTSFRHERGATSTGHPFVLDAKSQLMGRGRLQVRFEVPFDAPDFTMAVRGSLGPMPATAFNPLISAIMPVAIKGGDLQGLTFAFRVTNGHASGQVTPLYTGFGLDVTGHGMTGVLANHGILGGIARGAAEIAAGHKVNGNNPDQPGKTPRVGAIQHTFDGESVPTFFWETIRSGLLPVIVK